MIIIKAKRNKGKTTRLVGLLQKNSKAILLVFNRVEVERIIREYSLKDSECCLRIFSWAHYFIHPELQGLPLLIDNINIYLYEQFRSKIYGVSINED